MALSTWRQTLSAYGEKVGPCAPCNVAEYDAGSFNIAAAKFLTGVEFRDRPRDEENSRTITEKEAKILDGDCSR